MQEQADAIHRALTMSAEERSWRAEGLKRIVTARDPGDWVDDQLADIEAKRARRGAGAGRRSGGARGLGPRCAHPTVYTAPGGASATAPDRA